MANMVKVKILAHVGQWKPGDVAPVSEEIAKHMCTVRKKNNGHGLVDYRTAMLESEYEELKAQPIDKGGLTQGEMEAMGIKNVVETPVDTIIPNRLKSPEEMEAPDEMKGEPSVSVERDADSDKAALEAEKQNKSKKKKASA